jgi:hypothetical protein
VGPVGADGQGDVYPVIDHAGCPRASAERYNRLRQLVAVPVPAGFAANLDRAYASHEDESDEVEHLLGAGTCAVVGYVLGPP